MSSTTTIYTMTGRKHVLEGTIGERGRALHQLAWKNNWYDVDAVYADDGIAVPVTYRGYSWASIPRSCARFVPRHDAESKMSICEMMKAMTDDDKWYVVVGISTRRVDDARRLQVDEHLDDDDDDDEDRDARFDEDVVDVWLQEQDEAREEWKDQIDDSDSDSV